MTTQKKLKALIRARMDKTGEAYTVARRHVLNSDSGYRLFGGLHPETASLANILANRGVTDPSTDSPISEALVLGVGGGLGAGYILWNWESQHDGRKVLTTGFRNQWQYPDRWIRKTCERLGVPVSVHETGGSRSAERHLAEALDQGVPALAFISVADLPFWHLPDDESGWWGYPVVVHGKEGGDYLVDDRAGRSIPVTAADLASARGRVSSYKNRLVVPDAAAIELDEDTLVSAVEAGIDEQIAHLSAKSDSFSLPAFTKWAKTLTDADNPKGWPRVFADDRGLVSCLVSTFEGIDQVGMWGGNLRSVYAEFLVQASRLTGRDLAEPAAGYRMAAQRWDEAAALTLAVPAVADVVDADRQRRQAIAAGDDEAAAAAGAASEKASRAGSGLDRTAMLALFGDLADAIRSCHRAEVDALDSLTAS